MKPILTILIFFTFIASCKEKSLKKESYNARLDIRQGFRFVSIYISESNKSYAVKGTGTYYTEPLKAENSDTSKLFNLVSANMFLEKLNQLSDKPIFGPERSGAPKVEIYYKQKKIYESYSWDTEFWELIKPIVSQIPPGYNPFIDKENPFLKI
jgi:hypothetical protein